MTIAQLLHSLIVVAAELFVVFHISIRIVMSVAASQIIALVSPYELTSTRMIAPQYLKELSYSSCSPFICILKKPCIEFGVV